MDLYACGFNAHRQLGFNGEPPADRLRLQRICRGKDVLRVLFTGWADTLLELDGTLSVFGFHLLAQDGVVIRCEIPASRFRSGFGDHTGLKGAVADDDTVYTLSSDRDGLSFVKHPSLSSVKQIAIAGNGCACALLGARNVVQFSLIQDLLHWLTTTSPSVQPFELPPHETATHLTAAATSFGLLTDSGTIYTWSSDTRPSPLGRPSNPDELGPLPVDALGGVPIKKLCCGGWLAAAVSRDNELYLWGGDGPGGTRKISDLERGDGFEAVVLAKVGGIEEEEDGMGVVDAAVGDHHIVALVEGGRVFAVGEGTNGQLGHGEVCFAEKWVECEFDWPEQQGRAVNVHCGPRNTFVIVERQNSKQDSERESEEN